MTTPRLVVAIAVALVLITTDYRSRNLEPVRGALSVVVYPLQYIIDLPVTVTEWSRRNMIMRKGLMGENSNLRAQNLLLRTQAQKFAAMKAENTRLRELLESSVESGDRVLVADLLAVELDRTAHHVILNKGSKHGVYLGQPLVDAHGVMGQIIHVGPFSATGKLITDVNHALPVEVNRSGTRAIAIGTGTTNEVTLSYVSVNADIQKGDLIVSSGLGGRFPGGYPVGEVSEVFIHPSEPFARVVAKPLAKLAQAREVLLVWPHRNESEVAQIETPSVAVR